MPRLQDLINSGSVLCTGGLRHVIALGTILPDGRTFWFFEAFGLDTSNEHHLEFSRVDDDGYYFNFYDAAGEILAVLSPLEDDDEIEVWQRWAAFIATPAGREVAENIATMRDAAVNWIS